MDRILAPWFGIILLWALHKPIIWVLSVLSFVIEYWWAFCLVAALLWFSPLLLVRWQSLVAARRIERIKERSEKNEAQHTVDQEIYRALLRKKLGSTSQP